MFVEELASIAVNCGLKLHQDIGPGLLENAYQQMFAHILRKEGLFVEEQVSIAIHYDGLMIEQGFRADILIEKQLLIELKSVDKLQPVHHMQIRTYLRFLDLPLGLLINFSAEKFKNGLVRVVNGHHDTRGSTLRVHQ